MVHWSGTTVTNFRLFAALVMFVAVCMNAPGQRPEVYVQHGPDSPSLMVVSSDNRLLITGDRNGEAIRFYDLDQHREVRTLQHLDLQAIALSPNGDWLVTAGKEEKEELQTGPFSTYLTVYSLRLWKVSTGEMVRLVATRNRAYSRVVFSPDGKWFATGAELPGITVLDPTGATAPRTIDTKINVTVLGMTPDGTAVITHDTNLGTIRSFDLGSGQQRQLFEGHKETIKTIAITGDGRLLASSSWDKSVRVWDLATGKSAQTFDAGRVVEAIAFSKAGDELWTVKNGLVQRWNVKNASLIDSFKELSSGISGASFSSDNQRLFIGSLRKLTIYDLGTKSALSTFENRASSICSLSFLEDADPHTLLVEGLDVTHLWDLDTGEYRGQVPRAFRCAAGFAAPSRDGKLSAQPEGTVIVLNDPVTNALVRRIETNQNYLGAPSLVFSPDGRLIAAAGSNGVTKIAEVATGNIITTITHSLPPQRVEVSPGISVTDPASAFPKILLHHVFSVDGKFLAGVLTDRQTAPFVGVWEVPSGREIARLTGHDQSITAVAFNPLGTQVATGDRQGTIKVWDFTAGRLQFSWPGNQGAVTALSFAPKDRLLSGGDDSIVRIWDLNERSELLRLVSLNQSSSNQDDTGWLALTPDGLFDGSPAAWQHVLWRFSPALRNITPVEIFFNEYFAPNLVTEVLSGKRPRTPSEPGKRDRRQPSVNVAVVANSPEVSSQSAAAGVSASRTATIRLQVAEAAGDGDHPAGSGARDLRLFRNGSLVRVWHGDVLAGKPAAAFEVTVPIVAGENRFTAYAFNRDNIKSGDALLTVTGPKSLQRSGVAYLLAVGVNEYANPQYNLKYAVADAQDFAGEVRAKQEALGQYQRIEVVTILDRDATKETILSALKSLTVKVQPEDAVIIYFAGHGVAAGNRFYLIPHDLGYAGARDKLDQAGLDTILAHGISDEELQSAVEGIDAGQLLMVIDACNSGQALEAEEKRRGPMNSKGLAQLAYEKGMYILTAAQSYQAALEASKLGHGYLTFALIEEGLKTPAADTDKDGAVFLREWFDYATARVPEMQQEKLDGAAAATGQKTPATPEAKRLLLQQTVTFTNGEENIDPTQRTLQRPRVFYRREVETQPLTIARP